MENKIQESNLLNGVLQIIEKARLNAAVFLNAETTLMYWNIGNFININLKENNRAEYGKETLVTLSQQLTLKLGKGFTYTALTRMCKVANVISQQNIATLSQQLSWSHLIELVAIENELKREFYALMAAQSNWGVRELRTQIDKMLFERSAVAKLPENEIAKQLAELKQNNLPSPEIVFKNTYILDFLNLPHFYSESELETAILNSLEYFIMELGNGFAFLERQKRIPVDNIDYHLDLLFYHRKLKRLIAIDLKLGKFKPDYKAQMELYLAWLEKNEMQEGEEKPIGLLLCSEGNTEHIELLLLNESDIKVAQFLTELPDKQWFSDKLQKALTLAKKKSKQ